MSSASSAAKVKQTDLQKIPSRLFSTTSTTPPLLRLHHDLPPLGGLSVEQQNNCVRRRGRIAPRKAPTPTAGALAVSVFTPRWPVPWMRAAPEPGSPHWAPDTCVRRSEIGVRSREQIWGQQQEGIRRQFRIIKHVVVVRKRGVLRQQIDGDSSRSIVRDHIATLELVDNFNYDLVPIPKSPVRPPAP